MTEVVISTNYERKIEFDAASEEGVVFTVSDMHSGEFVSTFLTPREIRMWVEALEPYAAKPKTSLELFDEMPLGAKFRLEGETTERVKVSEGYYVILGNHFSIPKAYLEGLKITEED